MKAKKHQPFESSLQQHWTDANCASCHIHIDNLGFAFENYDAIGQWRDEWENGYPVDATGSFTYQAFDNSKEMLGIINSEQRAKSCYAQIGFPMRWDALL